MEIKNFLGKIVNVYVDRPLGSRHPKFLETEYPLNYGYIPNTISGDGEEIDCYILGVNKPLTCFTGKCIAIIKRLEEEDDKLIIVPEEINFTDREIEEMVDFQEKYFKHKIIR